MIFDVASVCNLFEDRSKKVFIGSNLLCFFSFCSSRFSCFLWCTWNRFGYRCGYGTGDRGLCHRSWRLRAAFNGRRCSRCFDFDRCSAGLFGLLLPTHDRLMNNLWLNVCRGFCTDKTFRLGFCTFLTFFLSLTFGLASYRCRSHTSSRRRGTSS